MSSIKTTVTTDSTRAVVAQTAFGGVRLSMYGRPDDVIGAGVVGRADADAQESWAAAHQENQ